MVTRRLAVCLQVVRRRGLGKRHAELARPRTRQSAVSGWMETLNTQVAIRYLALPLQFAAEQKLGFFAFGPPLRLQVPGGQVLKARHRYYTSLDRFGGSHRTLERKW
jgi:hypothetical protein